MPSNVRRSSSPHSGLILRNPLSLAPASAIFTFLLFAATLALAARQSLAQDVLTFHNDNARSGVQPNETVLTPSNVNSSAFGKVFSLTVDGDVYAQPLYVSQYTMSDGLAHNVLIVATQHDWVYAFDADGNNPAQGYLWRASMLGSGETYVSSSDVNTGDITPSIGITGTPAIDRTGGTIYLVAKSKTTTGTPTFYQRLHALNLATGAEKLNGPTAIQAALPGTSDGGSTIAFDPLLNNQRAALVLAPTPNGASASSVYITWSSHGDNNGSHPYHGWVIGYNAANISQQTGAWVDTPNTSQGQGGIWMSGNGIASDGNGYIYVASGNGGFTASTRVQNPAGNDYGDTAVQLNTATAAPAGSQVTNLTVSGMFTPQDQSSLDGSDLDMGTPGVLLMPSQSGTIKNLLITGDKSGSIYLLNRDALGGYDTGSSGGNGDLQDFNVGYNIHSGVAFFNNMLYLGVDGGPIFAWSFNPSTQRFTTTPASQSEETFGCGGCDGGGTTPGISANGTSNAIVWALDNSNYGSGAAVLRAYQPTDLSSSGELYNSQQAAGSRDAAAIATKFSTPTIAHGRVYVGGRNAITVYGLLSTTSTAPTPSLSPGSGSFTTTQQVTITDANSSAKIYYTTNGATPTTSSTLYSGPFTLTATTTVKAIAAVTGMNNSAVASATYTYAPATAPTPSIAPPSQSFSSSQQVTITDANGSAKIYYTTNGANPTTSSTLYSGQFAITTTTTVKAIAVVSGMNNSAVASATYTLVTSGSTGAVSFSSFASSNLSLNGSAAISGNNLELTDGGGNESASAWYPTPVNVQSFQNDFTFQLNSPAGDGFAFVIQRAGTTALGPAGGGLGYGSDTPGGGSGIAKSIAVKFDLYSNAGEGADSTGLYQNGASPTYPAIDLTPTNVNLHSGDTMRAHMVYDGAALFVTITDTVTNATATQVYTLNIPAVVGASTAYIGFTAGTGGSTAVQNILNWTYAPAPYFPTSIGAGSLSLNGSAAMSGSTLQLTNGGANQAGSAWYPTTIGTQPFTTRFNFQLTNPNAEGFAFVIQGAGATAIGPSGGGLGYGATLPGGTGGIPNSVAIKFDLNSNNGEGSDSTGFYVKGASPTTPSTDLSSSGIDLHSGHVFSAYIFYVNTGLNVKITDMQTNATASQSYTVNIPSVVGSPYAWVGFTGSTGSSTATQTIQSWTYVPRVTQTIYLSAGAASFGSVTRGTTKSSTITVFNHSGASVNTSSLIYQAGFTTSDFSVDGSSTCGSSIPAQGSCTYVVDFTPTVAQSESGIFYVNAGYLTQAVNLNGTGK